MFSWVICDENCHIIRCIRITVSKGTSAYVDHGKTTLAKRKSRQKGDHTLSADDGRTEYS
jgi:hypothetical protein